MINNRSSNIELLRIVSIIIIIAHHYVVNSGIMESMDYNNITFNMIFLQCVGFGGKMAINVFVLISSYFICTQTVTWKRVIKLLLTVYFYVFTIFIIFLIFGYESILSRRFFIFGYPMLSITRIFDLLFAPFQTIGSEFIGSFLVFYMLVPLLNRFAHSLTRKEHLRLSLFLVIVCSVLYTFIGALEACRYVLWFIVLYFIASYIRFYPNKYFENKRLTLWCSVLFLLIIWSSILWIDYYKRGSIDCYYLCIDSQKIMAFLLSVLLFLTFKNSKIKHSKLINTFAASTFGVLLIHANSNAMRTWLWQDFLKVPEQYDSTLLPIHFIASVLGIYVVCVGIDYLRIKFIEKPLFQRMDKISFLQKECLVDLDYKR